MFKKNIIFFKIIGEMTQYGYLFSFKKKGRSKI